VFDTTKPRSKVEPFFMEYMASASNEDGVIDKENLTYSFNGVDFNSDGVVSVDEYYLGTSP